MAKQTTEVASTLSFTASLFTISSRTILLLPQSESKKLPSRGMAMITGTLNGQPFQTTLEPDGRGSHWFELNTNLRKAVNVKAGDTVTVRAEPTKEWTEPELPADLKHALADDEQATALWQDITPMARWDWIRWIQATNNQETRAHRIEVAFSKLKHGERRPCCFNRTICTDPTVSSKGMLLIPTDDTKNEYPV